MTWTNDQIKSGLVLNYTIKPLMFDHFPETTHYTMMFNISLMKDHVYSRPLYATFRVVSHDRFQSPDNNQTFLHGENLQKE